MTRSIFQDRAALALVACIVLVGAAAGCTDEDGGGDGDGGAAPVAKANASSNYVDVGQPVSFDGSDSIGTDLQYRWDFGDGAEAEGALVEHTFPTPGSYRVTLTVADEGGEQDRDSIIVKVNMREIIEERVDVAGPEYRHTIDIRDMASGFKLTLTYPTGQVVAGVPQNDLDLVVYYPNGTEARSSEAEEPDAGTTQQETVEVPQQMLAEGFFQDWELVVRLDKGLSVEFELEVFVMY